MNSAQDFDMYMNRGWSIASANTLIIDNEKWRTIYVTSRLWVILKTMLIKNCINCTTRKSGRLHA
jgi:hypothetical protein